MSANITLTGSGVGSGVAVGTDVGVIVGASVGSGVLSTADSTAEELIDSLLLVTPSLHPARLKIIDAASNAAAILDVSFLMLLTSLSILQA